MAVKGIKRQKTLNQEKIEQKIERKIENLFNATNLKKIDCFVL